MNPVPPGTRVVVISAHPDRGEIGVVQSGWPKLSEAECLPHQVCVRMDRRGDLLAFSWHELDPVTTKLELLTERV